MNEAQRAYLDSIYGRGINTSIDDDDDEEDLKPGQTKEQKEYLAQLFQDRKSDDDDDDSSAFVGGLSRGVDIVQRAYGSTLQGIGKQTGFEGLEEYGAGVAKANQIQLLEKGKAATRLSDVEDLSSFGSYAAGIAGESAPAMSATIAGATAGGVAGSWFPLVGTVIGAGVGAFVANMPYFYGAFRERQKEANPNVEVSEGAAALAAIPASALDSILSLFGAKYLTTAALNAGGGIFTKGVQGAAKGAIIEVPTEIGQAVLERAQAGLSIADTDAGREYIEAGVAAGLLGSAVGGAAGTYKGIKGGTDGGTVTSQTNAVADTQGAQKEKALELSTELGKVFGENWVTSQPQLAKYYEEGDLDNFIEKATTLIESSVQANKEYEVNKENQDALDQGRRRIEGAKSFIPKFDFLKQRSEKRRADALNPQTEIGKEYELFKIRTQDYGDGTPKTENTILDNFLGDDPSTQTAKNYKQKRKGFIQPNDKDLANEEYTNLLDLHIEDIASGKKKPILNVEKTATKGKKGKDTADATIDTTVDNIADAAVDAVETEVVKKARPEKPQRVQARAYAVEKLGENWEEGSSTLSQKFAQDKNIFRVLDDGRTKWQKAVDEEVAAREAETKAKEEPPLEGEVLPPEEKTTDVVAKNTTDVGMAKNVFEGIKLSGDQQKIIDVLTNAAKNNTLDSFIDSQGKPINEPLLEAAGLSSKQSNYSAIKGVIKKISDKIGGTPEQVKARLNETRFVDAKGNVRAEDAGVETLNEASEQFDASDLGSGTGTVGGVGSAQTKDAANLQRKSREKQIASYKKLGWDVTPEQIDQLYNQTKEPATEIEQENQAKALESAKTNINRFPETTKSDAQNTYNNNKSSGSLPYEQLSPIAQQTWLLEFNDYRDGNTSIEELAEAQRDIEINNQPTDTQVLEAENENDTNRNERRQIESEAPDGQASKDDGSKSTTQSGIQSSDRKADSETEGESFLAGQDKTGVKVEKKRASKLRKSTRETTSGAATVESVEQAIKETFGGAFDTDVEVEGPKTGFKLGGIPIGRQPLVFPNNPDSPYSPIIVHETAEDAFKAIQKGTTRWRTTIPKLAKGDFAKANNISLEDLKNAAGFINPDGTTTHLIAENIEAGTEKGVIQHEVGVHLGLERLLRPEQVSKLSTAVDEWRNSPENSVEREIHDATMKRLAFARLTGMDNNLSDIETIAYAVEEAVNRGIEPNAKSKSIAAKWLSDIQSFFSDLISRFAGKKQQISPSELVALSQGAAAGAYRNVVVEMGATSDNSKRVAEFYGATDRYGQLEYDATIRKRGVKGGEIFNWGKESKFGEFTDITTIASFTYGDTGTDARQLEVQLDVYAGKGNDPILILEAGQLSNKDFIEEVAIPDTIDEFTETNPRLVKEVQSSFFEGTSPYTNRYLPNVFNLLINAVEGGRRTKAVGGDTSFLRLEGVTKAQTQRILAEFRRRITRHRQGLVPNVLFTRVTGAAVNKKVKIGEPDADGFIREEYEDMGRPGAIGYKTALKRFSLKKNQKGVSIQNAKGRDWVKRNLGEDSAQFYDGVTGLVTKPKEYLKFLYDFVHDASEKMPSAKVVYNALKAHDAVRNVLVQEADKIAVRTKKLTPERYALVNEFISKSGFFQKWGYDPKEYHPEVFEDTDDVKVDPLIKIDFNRLNDFEKEIVADIFAYGAKRRKEMQDIVKEKGITNNFFATSSVQGPYSPFKRFGNYVTVLKSKELQTAEDALEKNNNTENRNKVEELKKQGKHYVVQFFDTKGAANRFAEKNYVDNGGKYDRVEAFPRSREFENQNAPPTQLLESLLGKLKADNNSGLDQSTKDAFRTMILEHYYDSMDSRDARTSGARRLNRAGYDKDMIRSFIFQARAGANLIATMKTSAEINEALAEAQKEAAKDRGSLQETYQMLNQHYIQTMRREDGFFNAIQDRIAAFNTVSMLTTNFAYHVQNATQVLIAVNKLAGDFGIVKDAGYARTWNEMFKAYRIAHKAIKGGNFFKQVATVATIGIVDTNNNVEIDNTDGVMPKEYQELVRQLELHQLADVGIQEDLNQVNRFDTGFGLINKATDVVSGMTHRLYQVARYVEAHNRLSTAIAAYEMAKKNKSILKKLKIDNPIDYAVTAVQHTQGAFNALDAPLAIKKLPKLTTQYRKYQIMMAWNYGRAMRQAFAGESPEVKMIGKRTLGVTLAHAGIVAGLKGLPIITPIGYLAMMFANFKGDDDEDFANKARANNGYDNYVEQIIRENVEDKDVANLLTRGVPSFFGLDFSGKIGHQNIFAFQPYSDLEFTRDGLASYLFDVFAGPTASIARNFGAGLEQIFAKDNLLKGASLFLPKGARHYIDSFVYATDGYKANNGDVILDPRSISLKELIMTATGMPSSEMQNLKFTRGQQFKMVEYFTKSTSRITNEYLKAYKERDRKTMSELRKEWRELQRAKDRVRPFFNDSRNVLTKSPISDLIRKPLYQRRREKKLQRRLGTN